MNLPSLTESAAALERLVPIMLDMAAKSVMVLAIAGLAAMVMRRASAATRHWIWTLGFAGAALLPVLSATLPGWHVVPRLTYEATSPAKAQSQPGTVIVAAMLAHFDPIIPATVPLPITPAPSHAEHPSNHLPPVRDLASPQPASSVPPTAAAINPPASDVGAPPAARSIPQIRRSWAIWFICVWMAGTLLLLTYVFLGYLSLWLLQRRCAQIEDGDLPRLLVELRQELGIRANVTLLSSPSRSMPMTWGLCRARLLLPEHSRHWPREQSRAVLLHELGHIQRADCLTQLLAQVVCAFYWFNPLAWIAARRMQIERERACDDRVLNTGIEPSSYAKHLLHSASAMPALGFVGAAIAMARPSTLEERLRAIMDTHRNRRSLGARAACLLALMLLGAAIPVAALKAQVAPAPAPPPADPTRLDPTTRPSRGAAAIRSNGAAPRRSGMMGLGDGSARDIPTKGGGPTCSLDATIYDVRIPVEEIGRLDIEALEKASTNAEAFEKALAGLGTARPLYRASESVRLSGDTLLIGTETPMVTGSSMTGNGQAINSVTYQSIGARFGLAGTADNNNGDIDLDLNIQLSAMSESAAALSDKVKAPLLRTTTISHKGVVQPHKPFVVVSVDAASTDASGKAVAYIGRIVLGDLHRASPPAESELKP